MCNVLNDSASFRIKGILRHFCIVVISLLFLLTNARAETLTVAVVPFSNNTGQEQFAGLSSGIADLLATELANGKDVQVADRSHLESLIKEQALSLHDLQSLNKAVEVGKLLAVDRLIAGGVMKVNNNIAIVAQVIDINSSRIMASFNETGLVDELLNISFRVTQKIHGALDIPIQKIDLEDIDHNPIASLHFMKGLGLYYAGNRDWAIMEFMKSSKLNPAHDASVYYIALNYFDGGEYKHAQIECQYYIKMFEKGTYVDQCHTIINLSNEKLEKQQYE